MISLNDLRERSEITTGEALLATFKLSEKYISILSNILRIKESNPEEGELFKVKQDNTGLLRSLQQILIELEGNLTQIEQELTERFSHQQKNEP